MARGVKRLRRKSAPRVRPHPMASPHSGGPQAMSSARFTRRRSLVAAATLAALVALGAGAFALRSTDAESKAAAAAQGVNAPQAMPVPVQVVQQQEVTTWDEFSGRLEAVERVDVRSRVAGAVKSVHFVEGALVKRDDLLITIDPDPYAAEVERAQAQLVAAQARLTYTKSEHERARRLWDYLIYTSDA